jgi:hypothetical protein
MSTGKAGKVFWYISAFVSVSCAAQIGSKEWEVCSWLWFFRKGFRE